MTKFKYNYIGNVCDVKSKSIETSKFTTKDIPYPTAEHTSKTHQIGNKTIVKTFSNHKELFFCRCGKSFEINCQIVVPWGNTQKAALPSYCKKCGNSINRKDTIILNRQFFDNKTKFSFCCFEDENRIQLVKFEEFTGVNMFSKKIFRKEYRSSIVFNKKSKRFYLYDSRKHFSKVVGIGIFKLHDTIHNFIQGVSLNIKVCYREDNKVHMTRDIKKSLVEPLNQFSNSLLKLIDKRDVKRLSGYLSNIQLVLLNSSKNMFKADEHKKDYVNSLIMLISIIQYSYLSNILFNKGPKVYLAILENSPSVSYFNKIKPTSPIKILKEMVIGSMVYTKYLTKTELKFYTDKNLKELKSLKYSDLKKLENGSTLKDILLRANLTENKIKRYKKILIPNIIYKKIGELKTNPLAFISLYLSLVDTSTISKEEILNLIEKNNINDFNESVLNLSNNSYYNHPFFEFKDEKLEKKVKHFLYFKSNTESLVLETPNTSFYRDTVRMLEERNQSLDDFFKIKKWDDIIVLHDELYTLINLEKIEKFNKGIREFSKKYSKIKVSEIDGITFKLIDDVISLEKESKIMNHCVKSYARELSQGRHLLFSVIDNTTGDRATLDFYNLKSNSFSSFHEIAAVNGIQIDDFWRFSQLKSKWNRKATQRIIDSVKIFCEDILTKNNIKHEITFDNYDLKLEAKGTNYGIRDLVNDEEIDAMIEDVDILNDDLPF